jgi:WD repeat-containing protein 19
MLYNGEISCLTQSGKVVGVKLSTHTFVCNPTDLAAPEMRTAFEQSLLLKRFREAWSFASAIDSSEIWGDFAKAALHHVDIELAIRVYRRIGDVGMVWSLQGIQVEVGLHIPSYSFILELFSSY